jgi:integrase
VTPLLRKAADGTSRRARPAWTRLMPTPGYRLSDRTEIWDPLISAQSARCRKAGVRYIKPHGMRRTCASLLAALDVHPRVAMRILRHSKIAVTMEIYTEVPDDITREARRTRLGARSP